MKIIIASDHAGFSLKEEIKSYLISLGHDVNDQGTDSNDSVDYPDYALKVAEAVSSGRYLKGILICGTGGGMAIAANKLPDIRAYVCSSTETAKQSREHGDSNTLVLGAWLVEKELAKKIVNTWLSTEFYKDERYARRLEKIKAIERRYLK